MSIESRSRQYGIVFDHWQIKEFLGSGSGGRSAVFRLVRSDSTRGVSALKVINLIEGQGRLTDLSDFRRREYDRVRRECSKNAEQEVWLMDELRGNTNIVDYLDHATIEWSDATGFGRDLLIRMELLTDLRSDLRSGRIFSEDEVIRIGRDICTALILCHRRNILHRDVKPENIFRNKDGNYKLGDFGISRVLDSHPDAMASTGIGTFEYWPAEQMTGRYDKRVDIYSLGLVLYELCNRNRLPFAAHTHVTGREVSLRLSGTPLPPPCDAGSDLARVILTACAHDPEARYQNAEALLKDLNQLMPTTSLLSPLPPSGRASGREPVRQVSAAPAGRDSYRTQPAGRPAGSRAPSEPRKPAPTPSRREPEPRKKRSGDFIQKALIVLLSLCIVCVGVLFAQVLKDLQQQTESTGPIETLRITEPAPVPTPVPTDPPETAMPETRPPETLYLDPHKVVALSEGPFHVAAVYEDGSVDLVTRKDSEAAWDASAVTGWKEIRDISAEASHIVGLKADGTVVAAGSNGMGECSVSQWTDIRAIATAGNVTLGLRSDGTVVAAGDAQQIGDVSGLSGVAAIDLGSGYLEYLLTDGTWARQEPDGSRTLYGVYPELKSIYSNPQDSIGILSDGTLVIPRTQNLNRDRLARWTDITQVWGSSACLLGLKRDGTVCVLGTENQNFRQNVTHWTGITRLAGASLGITEEGIIRLSGDLPQYFDISPLNKAESVRAGSPGRIAHTDAGANVRCGPGTEFDQVTKLPPGFPVIVLEQTAAGDGRTWGRTMYGWVCMDYVELN